MLAAPQTIQSVMLISAFQRATTVAIA